jgi:hypothetical protein
VDSFHARERISKEQGMNPKKIAVATTTFMCAALLSVTWSERSGLSLSVQNAQAEQATSSQMHRHSRSHMARGHMARGHMERDARGYGRGPNPVEAGANVAAGAVNTAGAIAFGALDTAGAIATAPFGGSGWNDGYYASSTWGDYDCRYGAPGCRPYAEKWAQSGPSYEGGSRDMSRPGGRGVSRKAAN